MIAVQHLRFRYPRSDFELRVDNLEIPAGEKVAIVGPSGCGKTTLLNLVCGISVPDAGFISVLNSKISGLSDSDRRDFRISKIGMVFQQFELVDYLNASDNIRLPFLINRSLNAQDTISERTLELARRMGLESKLRRFPGQLSQGEQQRVAICRALVTNPGLVLADEPTGNLDPDNKDRILQLMFDVCDEDDRTLVVVTHDVNRLSGFDRVIDFEKFRNQLQDD